MREERLEVDGIPAKLYATAGADALLLLGHGGGHSKDGRRFVDLSRRYAEQTGLAVVCIDAVDHGERKLPTIRPGVPRGWHSNTIDPMVTDWRRTAEALSSIGPAVAYVGFSMGAIFGPPVVAAMPSMRVAVFVVGGIPTGGGIDDPPLGPILLECCVPARTRAGPHVEQDRGRGLLDRGDPGRVRRHPRTRQAPGVLGRRPRRLGPRS